jgi:hypothetical protein
MTKVTALLLAAVVVVMMPPRAGAESTAATKPHPARAATPLTRLAYCAYAGGSCSSDNDCCAGSCNAQHKCSK